MEHRSPPGEYSKLNRNKVQLHGVDKRRVQLAAAALASAAGETTSAYDGSPMAARVPAPAAVRSGRAQAQAAKAAERPARALAAVGLRIQLSPILDGETERPTRELVNAVKEISKIVLTKGACYSAAMATLSAAGWAASAFGEQLQTIITERRQIERTSEGTNASDLLAFRSAWPKAVVDALMRAVMPKSMHGLEGRAGRDPPGDGRCSAQAGHVEGPRGQGLQAQPAAHRSAGSPAKARAPGSRRGR